MRKKVVVVVALVALAGVVLFAVILRERERKDREKQLSSYYDVRPGMSKNEVGYVLGYPTSVQGPYRRDPARLGWLISDPLKLTKAGDVQGTPPTPAGGSALAKYHEWNYDFPPDEVVIQFDPARGSVVSVRCMKNTELRNSKCPQILGVSIGSSEAAVIEALGKPPHQDLTGIFKSMRYPPLGLELMLTRGRVYLIKKTLPDRR